MKLRHKIIISLIICFSSGLFISFILNASSLTINNYENNSIYLEKYAKEINGYWVNSRNYLHNSNKATGEQIKNRIDPIKYYSHNRYKFANASFNEELLSPFELKIISFAIIWQESWFVNYSSQDNDTGFGFAALQWTTAEWLAEIYNWDWEEDKSKISPYGQVMSSRQGDKLQVKYMIGYLLWLYDYYDNNVGKTITGYNRGTRVNDKYYLEDYYLDVLGKIYNVLNY